MHPKLSVIPALFALGALGCEPSPAVTVADDLDLHLDFDPQSSALKTPYVRGTDVRIFARDDEGQNDLWRLTSADPAVFAPLAITPGQTTFHASGVGRTRVIATRGGRSLQVGDIEVGLPTRIALFAHGPIMVRRNDPAVPSVVQVVVGHETTFLVRYLRDGVELHGNGVLSVETDDDVFATPRTSFLFENREWLTVQPMSLGEHRLTLLADGVAINTLTVLAVPDSAVEGLVLTRQSERGAREGDTIRVLAEGVDLDGAPVLGVDPEWDLDGMQEFGTGDLFVYHFDGSKTKRLFAHFGGATQVVTVHTGDGFVSSSNFVGCSGGGAQGFGWGAIGLALLAVLRGVHRAARNRA